MRNLLLCLSIGIVSTLAVQEASARDAKLFLPLSIAGGPGDFQLRDIGPDFVEAALSGDLYFGFGKIHLVGRYEEVSTLQIVGGFIVGGVGDATTTFEIAGFEIGTIETTNESEVVGVTEDGRLIVESSGVVNGGTGILAGARGALKSRSTVLISPDLNPEVFELCTKLILLLRFD